jgi:carbonic anhydrase
LYLLFILTGTNIMSNLAWNDALSRLKEGNARFVKDQLEQEKPDSFRRKQISEGQDPFAVILSCADSRVVPELVFDAGLSDLFVVRVAGNVANISSIASIEYAVAHLGTKLILVMGHEKCGAVTAAVQRINGGPNPNYLLALIKPAVEQSSDKSVNGVAKENVRLNAKSLVADSDILSSAITENDVKIITAYYNLESGVVDFNI